MQDARRVTAAFDAVNYFRYSVGTDRGNSAERRRTNASGTEHDYPPIAAITYLEKPVNESVFILAVYASAGNFGQAAWTTFPTLESCAFARVAVVQEFEGSEEPIASDEREWVAQGRASAWRRAKCIEIPADIPAACVNLLDRTLQEIGDEAIQKCRKGPHLK